MLYRVTVLEEGIYVGMQNLRLATNHSTLLGKGLWK